jgi:hypothetical protein
MTKYERINGGLIDENDRFLDMNNFRDSHGEYFSVDGLVVWFNEMDKTLKQAFNDLGLEPTIGIESGGSWERLNILPSLLAENGNLTPDILNVNFWIQSKDHATGENMVRLQRASILLNKMLTFSNPDLIMNLPHFKMAVVKCIIMALEVERESDRLSSDQVNRVTKKLNSKMFLSY